MNIQIMEEERQAILLALAKLSLSRPGWEDFLRTISRRFMGEDLYDAFLRHGPDRVVEKEGGV